MGDLFEQLEEAYLQCSQDPYDDMENAYNFECDGDGSWKERMAVAKTDVFLKGLTIEAEKNKPSTWRQRHPRDDGKAANKFNYRDRV